jgi:L-lactate dehydrogenase complex protein LldG
VKESGFAMASGVSSARDEVLNGIRTALGRCPGELAPPVPPTARVSARVPGNADDEITLLLGEIGKLGGRTRRLEIGDFKDALVELVRAEMIRKATLWRTTELQALGVSEILAGLGVEIVSSQAGKNMLAQCDLGVTGVDMALPETGTLVLRASPERSRAVSLLPRVHLALVRPSTLRADLATVLREMRADPYAVFVTGPSRTADIELTVTIGVHGPQVLYVWVVEL